MEITLQALMGAMKANFGRRDRDVEGCTDLSVRPSVHILHDDHRTQTRGKLAEGMAETASELELIDSPFRLGIAATLGLDDLGKSCVLVSGVSTPGCRGGVDRDSIQPCRECRITPEGGESPPHPNPGLLGNIGGDLMIVSEAKRQAVDVAAMTFEELGECRAIAPAGQRDQFSIIW